MALLKPMRDHGYTGSFEIPEGRNLEAMDLLFVTQRLPGKFLNRRSAGEEVVQDDLKGTMKSGDEEQKAHELLLRLFG